MPWAPAEDAPAISPSICISQVNPIGAMPNGRAEVPPNTVAYTARSKATPASTDGHWRIRKDRIDESGVITLRFNSRMHHIGIGRAHKHERVRVLIHNLDIRIINPATGELLRELTLDPSRDHQPQNHKTPSRRRAKCEPCPETSMNDDPRHDNGGVSDAQLEP